MRMHEPMSVAVGLTADRWLSELLGRPAWKLDPDVADPAAAVARAGEGPGFFFTRVPAGEVSALRRFENAGFHVVDTTIGLEVPSAVLASAARQPGVRLAKPSDRDAVSSLAARSFQWSRFHLDPAVPDTVADRSRAEWVSNFFVGARGDALVVAELDQNVAAFLLLLGPESGILTIDLIAVDRERRRNGLGAACIGFAAAHFAEARTLRVATQAANVPSLRFYENLGFRTVSSQYVLHLHRE
jgi:ribosomal protein S18 acetylase RimI-like enzyme